MEIRDAVERLSRRADLSEAEMAAVMLDVMEGRATAAQIGAMLMGLHLKGETVDEITGAARAMRRLAVPIHPSAAILLDTCGTGGDGSGTFNISTAAAITAAAAGVSVAKHGNRAMSGRVGAADVLEALGVRIDMPPERLAVCIDTVGFGFLFAQAFHPAMRHAAGPRRELGIRTIFNLLGPLANPAGATHQLVGVFADRWVEPMAAVLGRLGSRHALVVHGADGLDEISLTGPTQVAELKNDDLRVYRITPEELGLRCCALDDLRAGSADESAAQLRAIFGGAQGPRTDIVVLNAGAALYAADAAPSIASGMEMARDALRSGKAQRTLEALVEWSNR